MVPPHGNCVGQRSKIARGALDAPIRSDGLYLQGPCRAGNAKEAVPRLGDRLSLGTTNTTNIGRMLHQRRNVDIPQGGDKTARPTMAQEFRGPRKRLFDW